jgi:hypothetical protein
LNIWSEYVLKEGLRGVRVCYAAGATSFGTTSSTEATKALPPAEIIARNYPMGEKEGRNGMGLAARASGEKQDT